MDGPTLESGCMYDDAIDELLWGPFICAARRASSQPAGRLPGASGEVRCAW
jgi:hypothetical protein